ncbi:hypothetical protein JHD48_07385 [Sulfurimonas sp. SAG-AH-194-I05]|nr:hypothetical protein [Sulfurimonas sp. SAG-AH-194-I05]MDF1875553.1 hypothetical protein [Sulfurimonas sp. SAG-AH-194-I05]
MILDNTDAYNTFYTQVINKTEGQIHAYWMKEIFLGENIPAKKISQEDVVKYLNENTSNIVYSIKSIDAKVIYEH